MNFYLIKNYLCFIDKAEILKTCQNNICVEFILYNSCNFGWPCRLSYYDDSREKRIFYGGWHCSYTIYNNSNKTKCNLTDCNIVKNQLMLEIGKCIQSYLDKKVKSVLLKHIDDE